MYHHPQFSETELNKIHERLNQLEKGKDPQDVLLDNAEFQQKFKIGPRTAYNWRRKNLLKYLYIEKKVFYRLSDVREFLEKSVVGSPKAEEDDP